jgi:ribosomal protein S18 acetylase RimI-like enzyme
MVAAEPSEWISGAEVRDWWHGQELERDVRLLHDADGRLAAAGDVVRRAGAAAAENYVHPDFTGRGLGAYLVGWSEGRARELGFSLVRNGILSTDERGRELLTSRGYRIVRHYYRMVAELGDDLPEPEWPEGIELRTIAAGEERELYEADREAFAEEWGRPQRSFEEWWAKVSGSESFDASLTFVAWDGGRVAGYAICALEFGGGFVNLIGVRPEWRRRGVGLALLRHAFRALRARGVDRVGLGVDALNPTGATRLYERAGMHVLFQADVYEKELEP